MLALPYMSMHVWHMATVYGPICTLCGILKMMIGAKKTYNR